MKNTLFILLLFSVAYYFSGCGEDIIKKGGGDVIDTNILRLPAAGRH